LFWVFSPILNTSSNPPKKPKKGTTPPIVPPPVDDPNDDNDDEPVTPEEEGSDFAWIWWMVGVLGLSEAGLRMASARKRNDVVQGNEIATLLCTKMGGSYKATTPIKEGWAPIYGPINALSKNSKIYKTVLEDCTSLAPRYKAFKKRKK